MNQQIDLLWPNLKVVHECPPSHAHSDKGSVLLATQELYHQSMPWIAAKITQNGAWTKEVFTCATNTFHQYFSLPCWRMNCHSLASGYAIYQVTSGVCFIHWTLSCCFLMANYTNREMEIRWLCLLKSSLDATQSMYSNSPLKCR